MSMMNVERDFVLRPKQNEKFRKEDGEALLRTIAEEKLGGRNFEAANSSLLIDGIAATIRDRLKGLDSYETMTS
ncbi:hypothetical protein ANCCAN_12468 [Ancylostoma caninum]|uniref:Uncharacterized protein n=1 Tax=Ancylostoma caninum TaxID=29170 RepID=A0A368GAY4_ANCCA|nr:hypothetical protein ANCCAN_12468 [Ancylostoma caninum]